MNNTVRLSNADDIEVYADTVTLLGSLDLAGKQSGSGAGLPGRSIKIVARRLVCGQAPGKAQARCVVDTSGGGGSPADKSVPSFNHIFVLASHVLLTKKAITTKPRLFCLLANGLRCRGRRYLSLGSRDSRHSWHFGVHRMGRQK